MRPHLPSEGEEWRGWAKELRKARAEPRRLSTLLRKLGRRFPSKWAQAEAHVERIYRGSRSSEPRAVLFAASIVAAMAPDGKIRPGPSRLSERDVMDVDTLRIELDRTDAPGKRRALAAKIRRRENILESPALKRRRISLSGRWPAPPSPSPEAKARRDSGAAKFVHVQAKVDAFMTMCRRVNPELQMTRSLAAVTCLTCLVHALVAAYRPEAPSEHTSVVEEDIYQDFSDRAVRGEFLRKLRTAKKR